MDLSDNRKSRKQGLVPVEVFAHSGEDESPGVNCLKIAAWHLQDEPRVPAHHSHDLRPALHATYTLIKRVGLPIRQQWKACRISDWSSKHKIAELKIRTYKCDCNNWFTIYTIKSATLWRWTSRLLFTCTVKPVLSSHTREAQKVAA